jgi:hypothetical protein
MKMRELIEKFKPLPLEEREWNSADIEELSYEVGVSPTYNYSDEWNTRCTSHPVATWLCTDTHVGMHFITLDDEVVAVSMQIARKSDVTYKFVSAEAHKKLRDFILSVTITEEEQFSILDLDEEVNVGYTVDYGSNLLTDNVIVYGRPATVITKYSIRYEVNSDMWSKVIVQYEDDDTIELVDLNHVIIPFALR